MASLVAAGYDLDGVRSYTSTAIGITDKKHDGYHVRGATWLVSNPKGYPRRRNVEADDTRCRPAS